MGKREWCLRAVHYILRRRVVSNLRVRVRLMRIWGRIICMHGVSWRIYSTRGILLRRLLMSRFISMLYILALSRLVCPRSFMSHVPPFSIFPIDSLLISHLSPDFLYFLLCHSLSRFVE